MQLKNHYCCQIVEETKNCSSESKNRRDEKDKEFKDCHSGSYFKITNYSLKICSKNQSCLVKIFSNLVFKIYVVILSKLILVLSSWIRKARSFGCNPNYSSILNLDEIDHSRFQLSCSPLSFRAEESDN